MDWQGCHSEWRAFRSWPSPPPAWPSPTPAWNLAKEDSFPLGVDMGQALDAIEETTERLSYANKGAPRNPPGRSMIFANMAAASWLDELSPSRPQHNGDHSVRGLDPHTGRRCAHRTARRDAGGRREASLCEVGITSFNSIRALSHATMRPKSSRPSTRDREWFRPRRAAGTLVLESIDHAIVAWARIYGEVLGFALTCDA